MKLSTKTHNIWFISDTHAYHKNITRGVSSWVDREGYTDAQTRDFKDQYEMTEHIVMQINKNVVEDDILIHLGDWSFGGINKIYEFRKQLTCQNIHLILGNHDTHIKKNKVIPNMEDNFIQEATFRDLFVSVQQYLEIEIDGRLICLMHYPIESWNNRPKDSYHLHGHVHGNFNGIQPPNRLDVGIDSAFKIFGEYRPFSWEDVKKIVK